MKRHKPVIGLAGGIASGKSLVARMMAELGAGVIDADELNHEVLRRQEVRRQVEAWWGRDLYDGDGRLDRQKLAKIVFHDLAEKKKLEDLTHPLISELRQGLIERFEADDKIEMIVLDIPLLFEVGQNELCDGVIFVEVDERARIQRAGQERGWSEKELRRREKLQNSLDNKRDKSDHVVQNNSDTKTLRRHVEGLYRQLIAAYSRPATH